MNQLHHDILSLLLASDHELSGIEIVNQLASELTVTAPRSTVWLAISYLTRIKALAFHWESTATSFRRYFRVTEEGRAMLAVVTLQ